ncbi:MAG: ABC transporter ATP-binding protein [Lachnospiraceae bacterium]|nr:ABC transporter ATP-binding protein [Lachnospiraceae bacterium]
MKKQSNLSKLMGYAGNFRFLTYASWILSGVSAAFALIPFYFLWRIIKEVLTVMPDFSKAAGLIHNGWMAVLFAALSLVIYICALMCSHLAAFRVQANLRKAMLHHVITLPLGTLEKEGSGKVRKTIQECSGATETFLAHQLPDMVGAYVTPLGLVVLLFAFDWRFGLICLIPIVLSFVVMMVFMTGPTLKVKMQEYQNALEDMSNEAVEYVRGVPVVKTFGQTVYSFEKFKKSIDRYSEWAISYTKSMRIPMCLLTILINGIFAFILAAGIWFTKGGISTTLVLNILFYIILTPILTVTMTKIMFQSENNMLLEDAMKRMDNILSLEPLKETQNAKNPKENSVELRHVSYSYDERTQALKDISLSIKGGQTVAFVGPSGGGKTTLANVISRFFDVKEGEVLIGGVNVKDISKEKLMETVSFVFQNSRLIKGTILDNVKLGKPDATEEEVMTALRQAQCMDIVEKMPDGVHTVIGTNGVYLSGGEGQRIAIARALLKNAPIIILDEATAFADPDNEVRVQAAFKELAKDRTVIMIAHRLSTVTSADCIYVLKDGSIAEHGTDSELKNKGGIYAEMMKNYISSVNWKVGKESA